MAKESALDSGEPVKILKLSETPGEKERKEEPIFNEKELNVMKELGRHKGKQLTSDGHKFLNRALA